MRKICVVHARKCSSPYSGTMRIRNVYVIFLSQTVNASVFEICINIFYMRSAFIIYS